MDKNQITIPIMLDTPVYKGTLIISSTYTLSQILSTLHKNSKLYNYTIETYIYIYIYIYIYTDR